MNTEIKSSLIRVLPFMVILMILLLAFKKGKITANNLGINKPACIKHFFYWVIGFFVFVLLVELGLYMMWLLEITPWRHPLFPSIIRIAGAVILAPIAEEFIFRGLLLSMLTKRKINLHVAIIIQAVVFVLLHNFTYQNSLSSNIGIVQSLADAMLFGYAKQYTKSIATPIAMHITGNAFATLERFAF
jgi:membrane protease YdiL (CAAX protease family)